MIIFDRKPYTYTNTNNNTIENEGINGFTFFDTFANDNLKTDTYKYKTDKSCYFLKNGHLFITISGPNIDESINNARKSIGKDKGNVTISNGKISNDQRIEEGQGRQTEVGEVVQSNGRSNGKVVQSQDNVNFKP